MLAYKSQTSHQQSRLPFSHGAGGDHTLLLDSWNWRNSGKGTHSILKANTTDVFSRHRSRTAGPWGERREPLYIDHIQVRVNSQLSTYNWDVQ